MNPWEVCALQYQFPEDDGQVDTSLARWDNPALLRSTTYDPMIYPGLYSASGFDVMGILLRVVSRPNPQVELGPVDASAPLVLCDLMQPDQPIVYASDAFTQMTGYKFSEIKGANCRFLQAPGGKVRAKSHRKYVDKDSIKKMRKAVERNSELQIEVTNFKKNGQRFTNIITIIPVRWESADFSYSVGFQCEKEA